MFQLRELAAGELDEMLEAEADVEAWRQREGVKKDEGVVEGLLLLDNVGLDGGVWRARDETCRFGPIVCEVRRPGANVEHEALEPTSNIRTEVRVILMGVVSMHDKLVKLAS